MASLHQHVAANKAGSDFIVGDLHGCLDLLQVELDRIGFHRAKDRRVLRDLERAWSIPTGALAVTPYDLTRLEGLAPREIRYALLDIFGSDENTSRYTVH